MNFEEFLNWTVSIDCGHSIGIYQGQIQSIDQIKQTIQLKNTFHNGILLQSDHQHSIEIQSKDIRDLQLISKENSSFLLSKVNSKLFQHQQGNNESLIKFNEKSNSNVTNRNDSNEEKKSTNEDNFRLSSFDSLKSSPFYQEKYRCDQMILEHNNEPVDYELIHLPTTTKKYQTGFFFLYFSFHSNKTKRIEKSIFDLDEGIIVPSISIELRNRLFDSSEYFGYSLERRIESMGHSITDMCLHLLGGTQRLLMKNRHQYPVIVVLSCSNDLSGAYSICAARILATKNIRIHLYLPPNQMIREYFIENELKLFRTTQSILTDQVNELPHSPVDLVLNGLDNSLGNNSNLFSKQWYQQISQYCSRLQTSIIAIDPPINGGTIECKYSLVPLLPLTFVSTKTIGRIYLCDLAFGKEVFQHQQIHYSSPFGAKSFVALHDC